MTIRSLNRFTIANPGRVVEPAALADGRVRYVTHNWEQRFEVETTWDADESVGFYSLAEDRYAASLRPRRTFRMTATALGGQEPDFLEQFLMFASPAQSNVLTPSNFLSYGVDKSFQLPLECDAAEVTQVGGALGEGMAGDFSSMRCWPGMRVAIVNPGQPIIEIGNFSLSAIIGTVDVFSRTGISLTGQPTIPIEVGAKVITLMDCDTLEVSELQY
ncbi:MAG: hypothetical protein AAFP86_10190, partial [Planctomycetota bacterium]